MSGNSLSGTIPSQLSSMEGLNSLGLYQNSLSGTLPPQLSNLTGLNSIYLLTNSLSGTIPTELSSISDLQFLFLSFNSLSGSVPSELSSIVPLEYLGLARNSVSGHIPPSLGSLAQLKTLMLQDNLVSGTLPSILPPNIVTISVSNNRRVSGTLPSQLGSALALKSLLANGMSLSGTLPTFINGSSVVTASLSRNYLVGDIGLLASQSSLRTLVLSSNHLSCRTPTMDDATLLGTGEFDDPQTEARVRAFNASWNVVLSTLPEWILAGVDSTDEQGSSYPNTVLVFAGNVQLLDDSGALLDGAASRLLEQDRVRQGQQTLFPGHSDFKELVWLVLPGLVLLHAVTIWIVVRRKHRESVSAYLCRSSLRSRRVQSEVSQEVMAPLIGLALCGVGLVVVDAAAPSVYDPGCQDPLLHVSITGVRTIQWFQWVWVVLNCAVLLITLQLWERLHLRGFSQQAEAVLWCLHALALPVVGRAVRTWRGRVIHQRSASLWRRLFYALLHVPVSVVASLPALCFVLSKNVPSQNWLLSLLGNQAVVVVFKLVWANLLMPRVAIVLARLKHATHDPFEAGPELTVRVHKTQVTSSMLFEMVVVVLAPLVFVLVLDESCLRYYLDFSPELASLMEAWGINQRGWEAYRPGFCSRRLLSQFSYVWLIYALVRGLFTPTIHLIGTHPKARWLVAWFENTCGGESDKYFAHAKVSARVSQLELSCALTLIIVTTIFGALVPVLLLLLPLAVWLRCCALDLAARHPDEESSHVGFVLATRCLVQVPVKRAVSLALLSTGTVTCLIFVDLGFDLGPVLFYVIFCSVTLGARLLCRRRLPSWWRGSGTTCDETMVEFSVHSATYRQVPEAVTFVKF
eukprot:TRINITY_DN16882_c0_g1_i2.p1 TRINITY_DN16882_c0_g1~~TRINITY_DN16882_c0_g1_i2.p1  ORF type:complete len:860 (+),score=134.15 TRINITY_DN16882_c0_g1_i2:290-2869(+)